MPSPPFTYVPDFRSYLLQANLLNIHSHKYSGLANSKVSPLRIPPIMVEAHDDNICRPLASRRIRASSRLLLGNQEPRFTLLTLVSQDQPSVTGQAQGGPLEPPQNSSNLDTGQTSAG